MSDEGITSPPMLRGTLHYIVLSEGYPIVKTKMSMAYVKSFSFDTSFQ